MEDTRELLIRRIEIFLGKRFSDGAYETEELEDIHDLIIDYEDLVWEINKNSVKVSPDHQNLWICSQMPLFVERPRWNYATIEEIDRLFNIHEELREYF